MKQPRRVRNVIFALCAGLLLNVGGMVRPTKAAAGDLPTVPPTVQMTPSNPDAPAFFVGAKTNTMDWGHGPGTPMTAHVDYGRQGVLDFTLMNAVNGAWSCQGVLEGLDKTNVAKRYAVAMKGHLREGISYYGATAFSVDSITTTLNGKTVVFDLKSPDARALIIEASRAFSQISRTYPKNLPAFRTQIDQEKTPMPIMNLIGTSGDCGWGLGTEARMDVRYDKGDLSFHFMNQNQGQMLVTGDLPCRMPDGSTKQLEVMIYGCSTGIKAYQQPQPKIDLILLTDGNTYWATNGNSKMAVPFANELLKVMNALSLEYPQAMAKKGLLEQWVAGQQGPKHPKEAGEVLTPLPGKNAGL